MVHMPLSIISRLRATPGIRNFLRVFSRARRVSSYLKPQMLAGIRWIPMKTEFSNFYYSITDSNRADLANLISVITKVPVNEIEEYFLEVEQDTEVIERLRTFKDNDPSLINSQLKLGRRIGWYAIVRALKPNVVVETGVHHGLGALTLNCAVKRNIEEGFPGRYFGTDIDLNAGKLVRDYSNEVGTILFGDSLESLVKFPEKSIDLFINDSDHSAEYEAKEYELLLTRGSDSLMILGDNSHSTSSLREFSRKNGRDFVFFKEIPENHFYPGAGIGFSFILR